MSIIVRIKGSWPQQILTRRCARTWFGYGLFVILISFLFQVNINYGKFIGTFCLFAIVCRCDTFSSPEDPRKRSHIKYLKSFDDLDATLKFHVDGSPKIINEQLVQVKLLSYMSANQMFLFR